MTIPQTRVHVVAVDGRVLHEFAGRAVDVQQQLDVGSWPADVAAHPGGEVFVQLHLGGAGWVTIKVVAAEQH
ncbi:hypothetical protein CLV28_0728 [Sediminihabitans luteus]|uniref:Uncharacterized protein n=1 Tax=Sediminihabitans luteus TaxID=1138585 RepID=A0A2M9D0H6_9CELL|nr:hypothetical protein [Sediminihabitans luteus]PJJ77508.1 hypothetical protein CLV28_0728 [Sediminihabitans luteus]GII98407.1 hypothetical protein Slu03_07850 [Sediminihabitans luteus]